MLSLIRHRFQVKQAIGQANLLPWSNTWKRSHILSKENRDDDILNRSPQGGLIFHWLMSVAFIAAVCSIDATTESISLPGYYQAYAHSFVLRMCNPPAHKGKASIYHFAIRDPDPINAQ